MTFTTSVKAAAIRITVYHEVFEDVKGYRFTVSGPAFASFFIEESKADELARYMLFAEPVKADPKPE